MKHEFSKFQAVYETDDKGNIVKDAKGKPIITGFVNVNKENSRQTSASNAANKVYADVMYQLENGDIERPRKEFMRRCIEELAMTNNGASTYFHNKKRKFERGEDEYGLNKATNKKANERKKLEREAAKKAKAEPETPKKSTVDSEPESEVHRWQVIDVKTNSLIDSFTTRSAAQKFNKELKAEGNETKWVDGDKKTA